MKIGLFSQAFCCSFSDGNGSNRPIFTWPAAHWRTTKCIGRLRVCFSPFRRYHSCFGFVKAVIIGTPRYRKRRRSSIDPTQRWRWTVILPDRAATGLGITRASAEADAIWIIDRVLAPKKVKLVRPGFED